jgi:hypothetical protein
MSESTPSIREKGSFEHAVGRDSNGRSEPVATSWTDALRSDVEEDEAAFERRLDRMDEEGRVLLQELRDADAALRRRRWWVIGPWSKI